jgi:GLPGLI family protein
MKRIILSAFLSLIAIAQLLAQKNYSTQFEVQYDLSYSLDTLHLDKKNTETVFLYTGSDYGVFMNYNDARSGEMDEKLEKQLRTGGVINIETKATIFNKVFYKELQTGKVNTVGKIAGKEFAFTEPKTPLNWKFKDSTKESMGYTVRKATTRFAGRDYVAWFTLSVPIPDGPYLFCGLPGLIVELYDIKKDYHFKLKSLEKLEKPKIWTIPEGAKTVTKAEFKKLSEQLSKNAVLSSDVHYMMSNTPGIEGSVSTNQNGEVTNSDLKINGRKVSKDELRRAYKKNLESQNNLIELK